MKPFVSKETFDQSIDPLIAPIYKRTFAGTLPVFLGFSDTESCGVVFPPWSELRDALLRRRLASSLRSFSSLARWDNSLAYSAASLLDFSARFFFRDTRKRLRCRRRGVIKRWIFGALVRSFLPKTEEKSEKQHSKKIVQFEKTQ